MTATKTIAVPGIVGRKAWNDIEAFLNEHPEKIPKTEGDWVKLEVEYGLRRQV